MPIVNCFTKNKNVKCQLIDDLINKWSDKIEVDKKDISINLITNFAQKGENYGFSVLAKFLVRYKCSGYPIITFRFDYGYF